MRNLRQGIVLCAQVGRQLGVADGLAGGCVQFGRVHGQDGADVRMHDQAGEGAQDKVAVVQAFVAAALGVGDGDDAVEAGEGGGGGLQCLRQASGKGGCA